jgi:hypothetical protein
MANEWYQARVDRCVIESADRLSITNQAQMGLYHT